MTLTGPRCGDRSHRRAAVSPGGLIYFANVFSSLAWGGDYYSDVRRLYGKINCSDHVLCTPRYLRILVGSHKPLPPLHRPQPPPPRRGDVKGDESAAVRSIVRKKSEPLNSAHSSLCGSSQSASFQKNKKIFESRQPRGGERMCLSRPKEWLPQPCTSLWDHGCTLNQVQCYHSLSLHWFAEGEVGGGGAGEGK